MKKLSQSGVARMPLMVEELECRCLLSIAAPTATEQLFLELLNNARANPAAYGASIGVDLSAVAPSQPLAFDPRLIDAAQLHSIDMNNQGYFNHNTPQGVTPGQRITAAGFNWQSYGESIAGAYTTAADALSALIIDQGVPDLGHRDQLLSINTPTQPSYSSENAVGIGIVLNGTGPLGNYYTIDTANALTTLPYITGVVMNSANGNGTYAIGEGIGNVTVSIAGGGSVTTWATGGYSLQVGPGTYTVTASGGGLTAPISRVVTVGSQNVSLNFTASSVPPPNSPFVPKIYQAVLGRQPSAQDIVFWNAVIQSGIGYAAIASAVENSPEAYSREILGWYQTYLGRTPSVNDVSWWSSQLANGSTDEAVQSAILGSPEYMHRSFVSSATGTTSGQAFIESIYNQVLDRAPSAPDTSYWLTRLVLNSPAMVAQAIVGSTEARDIDVESYYQTILNRSAPPSSAEVAFWASSALNLEQIRLQFETSPEFLS
jgi:Cysteine-rich secretory protein family/Domain of unknown function (DUF4214)